MNRLPEHKLLFACTRQQFQDEHINIVTDLCRQHTLDWEFVLSTARMHGVAPLVYYNLQKCSPAEVSIPAKIANQFKYNLMQNMLFKEKLSNNALKAIELFHENNIEVMFIKGGALDILVYEQPWFTAMGDVDLVINLKRNEVNDEIFESYMVTLHETSVEYDYYEHHDVTMNGILSVDFDRIWRDAQWTTFRGQNVLVMNPEDLLISVCINSCRKRYFRLKALSDIAEIINKFPQLNWAELVTKAYDYECRYIVYTALLTTGLTVGCNVPEATLEQLINKSIRKPVLQWLINHLSLTAFESLQAETKILDRAVNWSLVLPYATLRWHQIGRRIKFAWQTNYAGLERG